ncbi:MAG: 4,5-DOPA dioxygenase extradiol [Pseudomonadota bacterium]
MSVAQSLSKLKDALPASDRMPIVFLGHGNPMNAIEDNAYTQSWTALGQTLPRPKAILVISAHWMTRGSTLVDISAVPETIHDFYGFPQDLFDVQYAATGDPKLARDVATLLASHHAEGDETWGLDHGAWTVLRYLYPEADVPVFQLSIDVTKPLAWHLEIGAQLRELRDRGVLILGSGNVVHNLGALNWDGRPHDWALEFDQFFADRLSDRDLHALTDRSGMGALYRTAHPSSEHYIPSLTVAGAATEKDQLYFMTDGIDLGSLSMRSFVFHGS